MSALDVIRAALVQRVLKSGAKSRVPEVDCFDAVRRSDLRSDFRRQSFIAGFAGGTNLGTSIPVYDEFGLGGILNLGAFAAGQVRGQRFTLARLGTYTLISRLPAAIGGGLYAGVIGEVGDAWETHRKLHRSITFITGADTIIGPILVAFARGDGSNQRFYVTMGKTF